MNESELKELINNDKGFIKSQNYKLESANNEFVKLSYKIKKDGLNPYDIVHGGVLFGLADTASGVLAAFHNKKCVTTNGSINYLSPAREGLIYAIAKSLKEGKKIGYYTVDIYDENNNLLATSIFNMYYLDK